MLLPPLLLMGRLLHCAQGVRQMLPVINLPLVLLLNLDEGPLLPLPTMVLLRLGIGKRRRRGDGEGVETALLALVNEAIVVAELPIVFPVWSGHAQSGKNQILPPIWKLSSRNSNLEDPPLLSYFNVVFYLPPFFFFSFHAKNICEIVNYPKNWNIKYLSLYDLNNKQMLV